MFGVELWKLFVSLGVPGAALLIFYFLFKGFNWKFPSVPRMWVGPIVVLFMVLTASIVFYALTLWAPTGDPNSSRRLGSSTKELVEILHLRANLVAVVFENKRYRLESVGRDKQVAMIQAATTKFLQLHERHVRALEGGDYVLAHELLIEIHDLLRIHDFGQYREMGGRRYGGEYPGSYELIYPLIRDLERRADIIDSLREDPGYRLPPFRTAGVLLRATVDSDLEVIDALIRVGYDINGTSKFELSPGESGVYTALMVAAWIGDRELVEGLLARGADLEAVDSHGRTAADLAHSADHSSISRLLGNTTFN